MYFPKNRWKLTKYWGYLSLFFYLPAKQDFWSKISSQQPAGSNFGVKARFWKKLNNCYRFLVPVCRTVFERIHRKTWIIDVSLKTQIYRSVRSKNGVVRGRLPQRNESQFWVRASELHPLSVSVMREIINVQVGQCGNQIGYKVV